MSDQIPPPPPYWPPQQVPPTPPPRGPRNKLLIPLTATALATAAAAAAITAAVLGNHDGHGAAAQTTAAASHNAPTSPTWHNPTNPTDTTTPAAAPAAQLHLQLPDTFQQLPRTDNSGLGPQLTQAATALANPGETETSAYYVNDPNLPLQQYFAVAIESTTPFSSPQDRLNQLLNGNDVSAGGGQVTNSAPEDVDPSPLGGIMRCKAAVTSFDTGDTHTSNVQISCAWVDGNVAGVLVAPSSPDGNEPATTAALARQLWTQAQSGAQ